MSGAAGAGAGAAGAGGAAVVAPPAAIPFLLSPGRAPDILDLSPGGSGIKTYRSAIAGLDVKFDGTQATIAIFLEAVARRAASHGWITQLSIPVGTPAVNRSLLKDFGVISMADVKTYASTWIETNTRAAQNAYMLYEFLMDSLTPEFTQRVILRPAEYRAANATGTVSREDGPSLLKYVISLTYIDTVGSSSSVRDELIAMSAKFASLNYNVELFNTWVQAQTTKLASSGEVCQDLLHYLWKTYPTAPDQNFRDYIALRKSTWLDGTKVTAEDLMATAESRYATLVHAHTLAVPSDEQQELVALTAKISELKVQVSRAKVQPKKDNGGRNKHQGLADKKDNKKKGHKKATKPNDAKYAWKNIPPKEGAPTTKQVEGKPYNFCLNHGDRGMWVVHEPSECNARKKSSSGGSGQGSPRVERALNMAAIVDTFADDEQSVDSQE